MSSEFENNSEILDIFFKWHKQLLLIGLACFVLSIIFSSSFIITPKYKSTAVLYPANIIAMGTETATEQLLQILESGSVRDSVIKQYDLYTDYGIEKGARSSRADIIEEYRNNVSFRRTEFESVQVEVLDTDSVQARDMVNSIIYFFNRKERALQKEKSLELVKILKKQVRIKKAEMDSMEQVLTNLRKNYGILDYALQTEYATERHLEMISSVGASKQAEEIVPLLEALKEKGGEFLALNEHLWRIRGSYNDLKEQHEAAKRDVEKALTYCNIVTNPEVPDKKAYPVRWLIVLVSTLGGLFFCFLAISLLENLKTQKNKNQSWQTPQSN